MRCEADKQARINLVPKSNYVSQVPTATALQTAASTKSGMKGIDIRVRDSLIISVISAINASSVPVPSGRSTLLTSSWDRIYSPSLTNAQSLDVWTDTLESFEHHLTIGQDLRILFYWSPSQKYLAQESTSCPRCYLEQFYCHFELFCPWPVW